VGIGRRPASRVGDAVAAATSVGDSREAGGVRIIGIQATINPTEENIKKKATTRNRQIKR